MASLEGVGESGSSLLLSGSAETNLNKATVEHLGLLSFSRTRCNIANQGLSTRGGGSISVRERCYSRKR